MEVHEKTDRIKLGTDTFKCNVLDYIKELVDNNFCNTDKKFELRQKESAVHVVTGHVSLPKFC